ncbi:hypothetical protein NDU88_002639 [Pleurodeles waltl]|uniref:Uncharacterized protein n=1 Tax=Pleurodeles waltl TaxID=8319 RepID=A0AAV7P786_PLEWA|nr:hypothetical protein NDU88_002639 [Pleurodeles waltl]
MLVEIYYHADKQVDRHNLLAVHILKIDKKLQALNDLIRRAQTHSYTQQVLWQCASTRDNSPKTIKILNDIVTEVRSWPPELRTGFVGGKNLCTIMDEKGTDSENRNSQATCFSQQEENQSSPGCSKDFNSQATSPVKEEIAGEASNTLPANEVSLTVRKKKQQRKAQKKTKVAQQHSTQKSFTKSIGTQGQRPLVER